MKNGHKVQAVFLITILLTGCKESENTNIHGYSSGSIVKDTLFVVDTLVIASGKPILDISSVCFDSEGNIYFLDRIMCRIEKFDQAGNHVRSVSQRGNGPGEISSPSGFTVLNDDRLLVTDNASMRGLLFSTEGEFLGFPITWESSVPGDVHAIGDSSFVGTIFFIDQTDQEILISCIIGRFTASPEAELCYYRREWPWSPENSHKIYEDYERILYTACQCHNFYLVPDAGDYLVQVFDRNGDLYHTLQRTDLERVPKPDSVISFEKEVFERRAVQDQAYTGGYTPYPYYTLIRSLGVDSQGNLWVCRGDSYPLVTFDVWNKDGEMLRTVFVDSSVTDVIEKCTAGSGGIVAYTQNSSGELTLFTLNTNINE